MIMARPAFLMAALAAGVLTLAVSLGRMGWPDMLAPRGRDSLTAVFLGETRRLLANHFFIKADAYFHGGYYPSVFDNQNAYQTAHFVEDAGHAESKNEGDEHDFLGRPRNWLDRFGRHFYPSEHIHLGEDSEHRHEHGHGELREILPWLRLAATLDPENPVTYASTAYWLRRMGKVKEAEQFLREGLRHLPGDPQILFELGQIHREANQDLDKARNLWEAALRRWEEREAPKAEPNLFLLNQILANLAKLEEEAGQNAQAVIYLRRLKSVSPFPESIQQWMDRLSSTTGASPAQKLKP
jgi:tetratricopeptide (TPR) repeat protein